MGTPISQTTNQLISCECDDQHNSQTQIQRTPFRASLKLATIFTDNHLIDKPKQSASTSCLDQTQQREQPRIERQVSEYGAISILPSARCESYNK